MVQWRAQRAEQVIIVAGAQQALDLTARVLLDPNEMAWFEDPCYLGARNSFLFAGVRVIHIPVDEEGFDLAGAIKYYQRARLVYVTPSRGGDARKPSRASSQVTLPQMNSTVVPATNAEIDGMRGVTSATMSAYSRCRSTNLAWAG